MDINKYLKTNFMKTNIFLIITLLVIMYSCKKDDPVQQQTDKTEEKKPTNPKISAEAAKQAVDSFFNALPDKMELDYVNGREIHTMPDGTKKVYRISRSNGEHISKKADANTIIDITQPDPALPGNQIPGAIITLTGKYIREGNSYYQTEYVINPVDEYSYIKVIRSLFGVTRWVVGSTGHWQGYANYVIYEYNEIVRTKQVEWTGSLYIPKN